jgi:hypothetical protein
MSRPRGERRPERGPAAVAGGSTASPAASLVIVNWNTRDVLLECLASVRAVAREVALEVFVVDNGSSDGSADAVRAGFPEFTLLANRKNAGFARANNQAFPLCRAPYLLLLNPDTVIRVEAVRGLVAFMDAHPEAGAAGVQLEGGDGRLQNSYDNFPSFLTELFSKHLLRLLLPRRFPSKRVVPEHEIEVDVVIGACLILRRDAVAALGYFDEGYFLFVEESDLCWRLWRAGWKIYHLPWLRVVHGSHPSRSQARALATLESYRSTHRFFARTSSPSPRGARLRAGVFRAAKALKLLFVGLPLSTLATLFTFGAHTAHRHRLRVRATLGAWYVLGCPDSWGMRLASPFRGYRRQARRFAGLGRRELIVPDGAGPGLGALLERPQGPPPAAAASVGGERIRGDQRHAVYRFRLGEAVPGELAASLPEGCRRSDGALAIEVVHYRSRGPLGWLRHAAAALFGGGGFFPVPRGLADFERALEELDCRRSTRLPAGAVYRSFLGFEVSSAVAYFCGLPSAAADDSRASRSVVGAQVADDPEPAD